MGDDNSKSVNKTKLGQALQNAALENINEDIYAIHQTLEKILEDIPVETALLTASLKGDVEALEQALKAVPEQFDASFQLKMNSIIDITGEIDAHSRNLKITLRNDLQQIVARQSDRLINDINQRIQGFSLTSSLMLCVFGVSCSILGGLITSVVLWLYLFKWL